MLVVALLLGWLGVLAVPVRALAVQRHDVQASPFDGVRWTGDEEPEVLLEDVWYRPLAIDGVAVAELLGAIDRRWPGQRRKRFAEDLVEALTLVDWEGDLRVELELERVDDGARVTRAGVEMTKAKRNALRDAGKAGREPAAVPAVLLRADALADIAAFEAGLEERFAYLSLRDVDLAGELDRIREGLGERVGARELADALHRVLMRFGDGHASVDAALPGGRAGEPDDGFLPFLLVEAAEGVVAVRPDRSALVEPKLPVVAALDGRPLEAWLAAVAPDVAAGSPQLVRHRTLGALREVEAARRALGLATGGPLEVTFTDAKGKRETTRTLDLDPRRPIYGAWPSTASRRLPRDLAYLRIPRMDDSVDALRAAMSEFRGTRGLVVDVRGNGGGSRELLIALAGYLIGPDDPAQVVNVAAYRDSGAFGPDHLEARFMVRADDPRLSARARAAIEAFAPTFAPEWTPATPMSPWHYLVLDRTGHADEYHYDAPVVVLSDSGCFSATDIFLGALTLFPQVTLLGTPSSGGSARSQAFRLPRSGIEVRCASMASFRPDGRLYDGRGIEVDEEVLPAARDLLEGDDDAQLDAAVRLLRKQRPR